MFTVRRWWERFGTQTLLIGLAIGTAAIVRQTQGAWLMETYQWFSRPFQGDPNQAALQLENAQVLELQQRLIELQNRNQRLEELLGLVQDKKKEALAAPVIGRSADHWWEQLILGRGLKDGVQLNSVVMAPGGVVGRVSQVSDHASRVVLLSNAANQVGVTVSRSRATGYMKGQTGQNAGTQVIMQFFDKVPDVRKGDTVVTSAFSSKFPEGLPVGRIESIDLSKSPAPEAIIQLTAPISSLEWVVVSPPNAINPADTLPTPEPSPTSSFSPSPSPSVQP
ncbi:rod shape-determining protein MreC [Alkalinema sp. FACHB-956]|nr:rod shape-determining protein MreC [Alkalinema sp. FACHB-956]